MSKNILSIALLFVVVVSCTKRPAGNTTLVKATTTPSPVHISNVTNTPRIKVESPSPLAPAVTQTNIALQYSDLRPGQYILYETDKADKVNLSALSPSTGKIYPLYDASYPADIELSPSLDRLAIVKLEQVELVDLEKGLTKTIKFKYACNSAAWSVDESQLAVTCGDVFIVNFADSSIFQLTDLFTAHLSSFEEVSWSPDGRWLAYNNIADPSGNDPYDGIYTTDTACLSTQANCKQVTKFFSGSLYQFVSPTWSSGSSKLAFLALGNIFILNVDAMEIDSSIELIHENLSDITGLAWSLDGEQFAISNEIEQNITIISSKTGEESVSFPVAGNVKAWIRIAWPFAKDEVYQITSLGDNLNLRETPAMNGSILAKLRHGDKIVIIQGPAVNDGYTWWRVKVSNGIEGWVVDIPEWFEPENK